MSDPERPNRDPPSFEVPDLELEPAPRSLRQAAPKQPNPPAQAPSSAQDQLFGASFDFGDDPELDELEFERSAQPNVQFAAQSGPRIALAKRAAQAVDPRPSLPTGRAPVAAELAIDAREIARLADYGEPPESAPLSLAYAYRVFTRGRELKQQLGPISAERERAQAEREATLVELSCALRPALELIPEFRRFLAPLVEIEQRAAARGQALSSINTQLETERAKLAAELAQLEHRITLERGSEGAAQREHDQREESEKRAQAKLKRVQIEVRAVLHLVDQKLGPQGGQILEPEAAQLAALQQREAALGPEITRASAELSRAKQALGEARARIDTLQKSSRQIARQQQALAEAYQKELSARAQGLSEAELEQRAALADLARAVLAARGSLEIPEPWLERVSRSGERADALIVREEMFRRALTSYDVEHARRGVRIACTAVGLVLALFVFKLIF